MLLKDQILGHLRLIRVNSIENTGGIFWLCECVCSNRITRLEKNLIAVQKRGGASSCGCKNAERLLGVLTTHGKRRASIYTIWCGMKARCLNPKSPIFQHYGGRGIKICEKWMTFQGFYTDMGDRPPGFSLDRIDNNGNYCKSNCRWATRQEQARNKRNIKFYTMNGETLMLTDWANKTGISLKYLSQRIIRGASIEDAITFPFRKSPSKV